MIRSEILEEKRRVQAKLAEESTSIREYLERVHIAAKKISMEYGFPLHYVEIPHAPLRQITLMRAVLDSSNTGP